MERLYVAHDVSGSGQDISRLKPAGRGQSKQGWPGGLLDIGRRLSPGVQKGIWG